MSRALGLAAMGLGKVSPNPMVGCVIVSGESIVAEDWHKIYGGPHAEVNAVNQVADPSVLPQCTAYVNLEPCSHFGKTPPCADLLVSKRLRRVVIGATDPNPLAAGGIKKLEKAGIQVVAGVLQEECDYLNRRFFRSIAKDRPYIILKWAQTEDGFIARPNFESKWISGPEARKLVHKWRSQEDAVMVGTNTAHYDNPRLNVRDWSGRHPVRVVLDRRLRLSRELNLFDQSWLTFCYNLEKNHEIQNLTLVKLEPEGFLPQVMGDLFKRGIHSVMVEGGSTLIQELINDDLWDEIRLFQSPGLFEQGIDAPQFSGYLEDQMAVKDDVLNFYRNK